MGFLTVVLVIFIAIIIIVVVVLVNRIRKGTELTRIGKERFDALQNRLNKDEMFSKIQKIGVEVVMFRTTSEEIGLNCATYLHNSKFDYCCGYYTFYWLDRCNVCMGVIEDKLYIYPTQKDTYTTAFYDSATIPYIINVSEILYFISKGQVQTYSTTSGGGSSLGGAIVGGVLAGGIGAIIGSRKQVESTVHVSDNTTTELLYTKDGKGGTLIFYQSAATQLKEILPFKDYMYLQTAKSTEVKNDNINNNVNANNNEKTTNMTNTLTDEIKKFKTLLDEGIITQEDFDAKKRKLLGL